MPKRGRHLPNETQGVLLRPLGESEKIEDALLQMSNRLGRPLSQERIEQFQRDLGSYPVSAIEWTLDSWARNLKVLPALSDLLQLLRTWHVENMPEEKCSDERRYRHGKGYGTNDVLRLWKMRQASGKSWTEADYAAALNQLDRTRQGGAPEWRR
jgi:hypothetical protein